MDEIRRSPEQLRKAMEVFGRRMRSRQARKRAAATSSTLCTTTLNSIPTNLEPNQSKLKTESPAAPNEPSHSEPVPGISEASYGTHQIGGENDVRRRESFSSERSDNGRRPSAALLGHTRAPPRLSKSPSRESRLPIPVVREENIHQGSEQLVIERQDSGVERVEERSKENGSAIFDRCKDRLFIPSSSASDVHPVVVSGVYNRPDEMILEGGVERDSALLDFGVTNSLSGEGALLASKAESPPCEEVIKIPVEPHRPPRRRGKCKDASCQVDLPDEAMCPIVIHTNNNAIREINESHPHNLQVDHISPSYFRNFCTKMATGVLEKFMGSIIRLKRVAKAAGGQLLLDLSGIRELMLVLPHLKLPENAPKPPISPSFISVVKKSASQIEVLLKLICVEEKILEDVFQELWVDGTEQDLQTIRKIRGMDDPLNLLNIDDPTYNQVRYQFDQSVNGVKSIGTKIVANPVGQGIKSGVQTVGKGVKGVTTGVTNGIQNVLGGGAKAMDSSRHSEDSTTHSVGGGMSGGLSVIADDFKHAFGGMKAFMNNALDGTPAKKRSTASDHSPLP